MASITTFSGVGSGIDFSVIRDAIISQRSVPVTRMQQKSGEYSNKVTALTQLNTALAALTSASQLLVNRDLGTGRSTTTSDAAVAVATTSGSPAMGSYDINVERLATSLAQASRSYLSTNSPILAGGATTATFSLLKGGVDQGESITIDSSNNTLAGLRDAINNANAGVTASIVDVNGDGSGQQLVLKSADLGTSGRVELIETTATGTLADLNVRSLNPPDGDFSKLNASLAVNGLTISRSTNSISDAVSGVTLSIKKTGSTTIGVTQATDIESKLRGFINAYNNVQAFVAQQYTKDAQNRPTGILAGDSTLRNVQQQLRDALNSISTTNGGTFSSLSDIGVTKDATGNLVLETDKLNTALKDSPASVRAFLFGATESDKGFFQNFNTVSNGLSDSIGGSVQTAIENFRSSITNLNDRISDRLAALSRLKESLTKQYSIADSAIGQLNNQGTALTNIVKSWNGSSEK